MDDKTADFKLSDDLTKRCSDIMEWKSKYSNIYYQKIGGHEYIFRILTKSEYLTLYFLQFHVSSQSEDVLLDKCVLYPSEDSAYYDDLPAGEVAGLVARILSLSGFSNLDSIKEDLDKARENIKLLDNQMILIICKAFPHITPSDIDSFDYPTIIHHVSLAEELLGTKLEITKPEDKDKIDFDRDNREQGFSPGEKPMSPSAKQPRR
jgi:hypothetical protein